MVSVSRHALKNLTLTDDIGCAAPNTLDGSHLNALQQEGARLRFCDDGSVVASYRDVPRHRLPAWVHANPNRINRWLP